MPSVLVHGVGEPQLKYPLLDGWQQLTASRLVPLWVFQHPGPWKAALNTVVFLFKPMYRCRFVLNVSNNFEIQTCMIWPHQSPTEPSGPSRAQVVGIDGAWHSEGIYMLYTCMCRGNMYTLWAHFVADRYASIFQPAPCQQRPGWSPWKASPNWHAQTQMLSAKSSARGNCHRIEIWYPYSFQLSWPMKPFSSTQVKKMQMRKALLFMALLCMPWVNFLKYMRACMQINT